MKNNTLLGNFQSVSQFEGHNGAVKNQFIIHTDKGLVFQSYNTIIAAKTTMENGDLIWVICINCSANGFALYW